MFIIPSLADCVINWETHHQIGMIECLGSNEQVLYASNIDIGTRLDRLSMWMGSWHIFKNAAERVFTVFLSPFLAGAIHSIAPGNKIFTSPRLVEVLGMFLRLRFAYPSFKSLLLQSLQSQNVSDDSKSVLLNMKDLFEFFIPTVSSCV